MAIDLIAENAKLAAAQQRLETAKTAYSDAQRALLASDGKTPIYGADEHTKRTAAVQAAFVEKANAIDTQVDAIIGQIETARLNPFADPLAALDLANLELAGKHRVFVAEDCATLPVPELIGRLEWAAKHPGVYLRLLYGRYGLQRFNALLDAKPQPPELPELRAALEALGAIGGAKGLSPELQELRYRADAVKRATAYARSGQKPSAGPRITL